MCRGPPPPGDGKRRSRPCHVTAKTALTCARTGAWMHARYLPPREPYERRLNGERRLERSAGTKRRQTMQVRGLPINDVTTGSEGTLGMGIQIPQHVAGYRYQHGIGHGGEFQEHRDLLFKGKHRKKSLFLLQFGSSGRPPITRPLSQRESGRGETISGAVTCCRRPSCRRTVRNNVGNVAVHAARRSFFLSRARSYTVG